MTFFTHAAFTHQLQREISGSSGGTAGYGCGGAWVFAAASSVGNSLLCVALSCLTDLRCRRSFLKEESVRQQQERQEQEGHRQKQPRCK